MNRIVNVPRLPDRPEDGHKGLFGRVLVVGGNDEMLGAPVMAATAALKMGSGLVQIAVPRSILAAALSVTPELIGIALGDRAESRELIEAAEKADVIVLGPGIGQSSASATRVKRLIELKHKLMVIDADALNILAAGRRWPKKFRANAILTPHPGEMKRLSKLFGAEDEIPTDDDGRIALAERAVDAFGQIIVLKGHRTVVADSDRIFINRTGNSALSKAGAGDVLSGIIGSLLGQKMNPFDAACAGVHLHGLAGEMAGRKLGLRSVLARDVVDALPEAIRQVDQVR